jgi:hypothetical protein
MRRRTTLAATVAAVLALLVVLIVTALGATTPATAARVWVDAADVADPGDHVTQVHVADVSSGAATAVAWVDSDTRDVVLSTRPRGGAWSAPVVVATPATDPTIHGVGWVRDGVVGVTYSTGDSLLVAAIDAQNQPVAPVTLSTAVLPDTVSSRGGWLFWAEKVGADQQLVRSTPDGGNRAVVQAPSAATYLETVLAYDEEGFEYGWISQAPGNTPRVWTLPLGGTVPKAMSPAGSAASDLNAGSSWLLVWAEDSTPGTRLIRTAVRRDLSSETWSTTKPVVGTDFVAQPTIQPSLGRGQSAQVAWRQQSGSTWSVVYAYSHDDGSHWVGPYTIDSGIGTLTADQFSVGQRTGTDAIELSSDPVLVWCRPEAAGCTVRAAYSEAGAVMWSKPVTLGAVADGSKLSLAGPAANAVAWGDGGDVVRVHAVGKQPTLATQTLPPVTRTNSGTGTWSPVGDSWNPVTSYRVRTVDLGPRDTSTPWVTRSAATTDTSYPVTVADGHTVCVQVRPADAAGHVGADGAIEGLYYVSHKCIVAPLDERALRHSSGWTAKSDTGSYRSTIFKATRRGATLAYSNYPREELLLLVKRVPGGGTVQVSLGDSVLGTIDTSGSVRRQMAYLLKKNVPGISKSRTLAIRVMTNGKPVAIDGALFTTAIDDAADVNEVKAP